MRRSARSNDRRPGRKRHGATTTATRRYLELPLHQPFYDREWISVVPGPFTRRSREALTAGRYRVEVHDCRARPVCRSR